MSPEQVGASEMETNNNNESSNDSPLAGLKQVQVEVAGEDEKVMRSHTVIECPQPPPPPPPEEEAAGELAQVSPGEGGGVAPLQLDASAVATGVPARKPDEQVHSEEAAEKEAKKPEQSKPSNNSRDPHQNHQNQSGTGKHQIGNSEEPVRRGGAELGAHCKQRRLSYLQSLLLRKWPCLAIGICIMSSLTFGILLSALTVYLMHGVTDCSALLRPSGLSVGAAAPRPPPQQLASYEADPLFGGFPEESVSLLESRGPSSYAGSLATPGAGGPPNQEASGKQFRRLPGNLWPSHYELFVEPHISEPHFNFSGRVAIRMEAREATDRIVLHANELQVEQRQVSLRAANGTRARAAPKVRSISQDKRLQFLIVELEGPLEAGEEYVLSMEFRGNLNDDLAGFYKIRYDRPNSNETTWIAATQFQATDARRAFPCFDEPLYKATFSIKIRHWKNMTALSNMPIVDSEDQGLWVTDTFGKSHKMSTYLVAYAVTNFESRRLGNISVWTRPGFAHTAEYALQIAGKILRHYEHFFGIEYPLPKMDMIALPDFNAGAMENWGLITYRETAMLYDERSSSLANKQRVAVVVAHELAHQWFGNLVTPKWWDDLWLNEGFASYVEYIGVDHVEPQWRMLDQFVAEEVQHVFKLDGLSSSHQISQPVNNPDEISEIFDHISYAKGASIIRMMNHFLTEPVLKLGLQRYLRALRYDNAEQSDLWRHLTEAQRLAVVVGQNQTTVGRREPEMVNVERVMNSWTLQTGYPLVTLSRQYGGARTGKLEQVRFQPYKVNATSDQKWEIPVTYTWRSEQDWQPRTRVWMSQNSSSPELQLALSETGDDEWVLLNVNQVGYYRANYDQRNWRLLIQQLDEEHTKIGPINRAQILDDLFELARGGVLDYKFTMEATRYLRKERDYLPWEAILTSFSYIDDMLNRTPIYGDWKDYVADLIGPYYARYVNTDWTTNTTTTSSSSSSAGPLRPPPASNDVLELYNLVNAISAACEVSEHCVQKARRVFQDWRQSGRNDINPALRYVTYCTAIKNGNKDDWDFLWRAYEKEQNASERDRILRALGCSREHWILARYLEWTFSKPKLIRRQDGTFVFRNIAKNNYGREIAFNFMRERWSTIKDYYGKTSFSLGNLIRSVSSSMSSQLELQQLVAFYDSIKADVGTGRRAFQIAIEEAESNVAWRQRNYKIIDDWLQATRSTMAPAMKRKRTAAYSISSQQQ